MQFVSDCYHSTQYESGSGSSHDLRADLRADLASRPRACKAATASCCIRMSPPLPGLLSRSHTFNLHPPEPE